jgi:hypothetical protein
MMHGLAILVGLTALVACTPEPVHNADDVSGPAQPPGAVQPGISVPERAATQATTPQDDSGPASAGTPPAPSPGTTKSNGATVPSSTQANDGASPAPHVPNAMPQPDPL